MGQTSSQTDLEGSPPVHRPTYLVCIAICLVHFGCSDEKATPPVDAMADAISDAASDASDATATAADATTDASADTTQTSLAQKDLCPSLAAKSCAALTACGCPFDVYGAASCVEIQRGRCEKSIVAYLGGVSIGALVFDAAAATQCIAGFDQLATTCEKPSERNRPDACRSLFFDIASLGASCSAYSSGLLCAAGQGVCDPQTGSCTTLPKLGEPCQPANRCTGGLVCEAGTCVTPGGQGANCASDNGCKVGLACGPDNTCITGVAAGGKCMAGDQCAADFACVGGVCVAATSDGGVCVSDVCASGHYCVPGPLQQICRPKMGLNSPCNMPETCEAGLYCDYTVGSLCRPLPKAGEACPAFQCAPGFSCTTTGVCVPTPTAGQPCLAGGNPDCAEGFNCDAATKTCLPAGGDGSPCPSGHCASGTVCNYGTNPASCKGPGPVGTDCFGMDSLCQSGAFCDGYTNKCAAQSIIGGKCTSPNMCGPGNYCKFSTSQPNQGTCAPLPDKVGDPCDVLCGGGLRCGPQDGHCHKGLCALL